MIPDYQSLMKPLLEEAANKKVYIRDVMITLADRCRLSEDEREELLPNGREKKFYNRIRWAVLYLRKAGLLQSEGRGCFIATDEGRKINAKVDCKIDKKFLKERYESFREFLNPKASSSDSSTATIEHTPDELLRTTYWSIRNSFATDLLDRIREEEPVFFENLIISLLHAMGYGGASENAARASGQPGDQGVDGVIDQDVLGVDQIYVQAKRYAEKRKVASNEIRDFYGALDLKSAHKGLFFTTSSFSKDAVQTAKDLKARIVLIDKQKLADLMIQYNIGCRDEDVLHLKKIDEDFFSSLSGN